MTPNDISRNLPNGFHGAVIERITTNYLRQTAEVALSVLVPKAGEDSAFRAAVLTISGLAYLSLDAPDPTYNYNEKSAVEIGSLLETTPDILPRVAELQKDLGTEHFFNSFFVEEWNGFIHLAGKSAELNWLEG